MTIMRLDKYLKVSRLIKRRTVASDTCKDGRIYVNGNLAKPSKDVKVGDILKLVFGRKTIEVKILNINEKTQKADASSMYELINEIEEG